MQAQARQLERLASDLHSIAFDFDEPARSTREAERRIDGVERPAPRRVRWCTDAPLPIGQPG